MSSSDAYKSDHLILLIGSNPLPNYVAAHKLWNGKGSLCLLHTKDTEPYQKAIEEIFKKEYDGRFESKEVSESDPASIRSKIHEFLESCGKDACVGLNYTGGTKAMVYASTDAFRKFFSDDEERLKYLSYLDARDKKIVFADGSCELLKRNDVSIDMATLTGLHGLEIKEKMISNVGPDGKISSDPPSELVPEHSKIAEIFEDKEKRDEYENRIVDAWIREYPDLKFLRKDFDYTEREKFDVHKMFHSIWNHIFCKIKGDICFYGLLDDETIGRITEKTGEEGKNKFFSGDWLEQHVFATLLDLVNNDDELSGSRLYKNVVATNNKKIFNNKRKFEIDIAMITGYQLFGISCTVDNNISICKHKLFEIWQRARELGGDEACVALVCYYEDIQKLRNDVLNVLNDNQVEVFNPSLPEFRKDLCKWIKTNYIKG